ncbi:type II secretion system secretin GspD [Thiohalophilus sp.]|uniref:type II secretion system secretin GspD n=1 Tax=Thiohalophilus sp. TaxID=3028392 RepID=UPI002ACDAC55|nr:type II secretion system secretin GspD [Thiohalophilus sp.]MDZ7662395.1 type II secretion system secretin GspD [Thiohalophilus sp.]
MQVQKYHIWLQRVALCLLVLALSAPGLAPAQSREAAGDKITLNFEEADIRSVIALVSEQTGRNFIIDPRVKGKLTIISQHPVDQHQLYEVFLSALQLHGYTVVSGEGGDRVIPMSLARGDQTEVLERDEDGGRGYEFVTRVLATEYVEAAKLVPVLRPLLTKDGHLAAYGDNNHLIISDSAGIVERVRKLIRQIDRDTTGVTEVVELEHASAAEVVRMVKSVENEERNGRRLLLVPDERANRILIGGDPARRSSVRSLIRRLDEKGTEDEGIAVIYLRYTDAEEMVPVLQGVVSQQTVSTSSSAAGGGKNGAASRRVASSDGDVSIQAHKSTNALVISGPSGEVDDLRSVIKRLDIRRAQVLVEAIIAEVSMERLQEFGIQWGAFGDTAVGMLNFGVAGAGSLANIGAAVEAGGIPNVDGATVGATDSQGEIGALLRALLADTGTNVLSTPSVMTMDNEEAEIVVGQNIPFVTGRAIEDSGQAFNSIQRQDVGIKLLIRPQINEGDAIKLNIEQEVSSVAESLAGAQDLITNKRSIKTTAMVDDGQIIVLGGLTSEEAATRNQRVPGLGSIPGLGWLFRYDRSTVLKRNLMVFLRPRIVQDRDDTRAISSAKYQLIRAQQLASRERGLAFLDDEMIPVLRSSSELMTLPPDFEDRVGPPGREGADRVYAPPRPVN